MGAACWYCSRASPSRICEGLNLSRAPRAAQRILLQAKAAVCASHAAGHQARLRTEDQPGSPAKLRGHASTRAKAQETTGRTQTAEGHQPGTAIAPYTSHAPSTKFKPVCNLRGPRSHQEQNRKKGQSAPCAQDATPLGRKRLAPPPPTTPCSEGFLGTVASAAPPLSLPLQSRC